MGIIIMAAPAKFSGVLTPVITPFKDDLSPDAERLLRQCKWMISQNVGLAVFGTNSEANSLSTDEKIELMDHLVEGGIDPARMMPGTGCCAISDSVKLTNHAVKLGCGGALMLPPFYYKGVSDDGLYANFSEIIQKVGNANLRVYLYHIPPISNIPLSLDLIERLIKEYPNTVVGVKDSSGDWNNTKAMLDAGWDDFRVFAGAETFLLDNMRNGGAGCISATANVNPAAIHNLFANWQSDEADDLQAGLNVVRNIFASYPMIPALKAAAAIYGDDPNWCRVRPPLTGLDDAQMAGLTADLKAIDFAMPGMKEA
jgi:4-hydroxy-tetrahydrodipicolinate synthase